MRTAKSGVCRIWNRWIRRIANARLKTPSAGPRALVVRAGADAFLRGVECCKAARILAAVKRPLLVVACLIASASTALAQRDLFRVPANAKASVLIFTTIECPISNRYAPEILRLQREFEPQGISFTLVFPSGADTEDAIDAHVERFGYRMPTVRDPDQTIVKRAGATIAPETAVIDRNGQVVYRGRIDDRYVAFGVDRTQPTTRDLRDALSAVVDGRPVAVSRLSSLTPVARVIVRAVRRRSACCRTMRCASTQRRSGRSPGAASCRRGRRMPTRGHS
jgi:thiol-disulfide isomerase/thioredoxin